MSIKCQVSVKDLIHVFFRGHLDSLIIFSESIHDVDLAHLLGETTDHVPVSILPPWRVERSSLGANVALSVVWWDVKVSASGAIEGLDASLLVDESFWLSGVTVEPVGDVSAGGEYDWIDQWASVVLLDQLGQIVNSLENRNPAGVGRIVEGDL